MYGLMLYHIKGFMVILHVVSSIDEGMKFFKAQTY